MISGRFLKTSLIIGIIAVIALLWFFKGWFLLGLYYFTNKDYEKAEKAFSLQEKWGSADAELFTRLAMVSYTKNEYRQSADYILKAVRAPLNAKQQNELSNNVIRLITASAKIFTEEELSELLCKLPELPHRFLNPISRTLEYYPKRIEIVLKSIKDCNLTNVIPEIESMVFQEDEVIGRNAGRVLFQLDPDLKSPVWQKLYTGNSEEQNMIITILSNQHSARLPEYYLNSVDKVSGNIKSSIILALGSTPSPEIIDKLFSLFSSVPQTYEISIFDALQKCLDRLGPAPFLKHENKLLSLCISQNSTRFENSAKLFSEINNELPEIILDKLKTGSADELSHWIYVVSLFQSADSESLLSPFLSHADPGVVSAAIESFKGKSAAPPIKQKIYELVQHQDETVIQKAIEYIGTDKSPKVTSYLLALCSDKNEVVVESALRELHDRKDPAIIDTYRIKLGSPSPQIRKAVVVSISSNSLFKESLIKELVDRILKEDMDEIRQLLVSMVFESKLDSARPVMEKLLVDPVPEIRAMALKNLSSSPSLKDKWGIVIPLLDDQDAMVRLQAIKTLQLTRNPAVIPSLYKHLDTGTGDTFFQNMICETILALKSGPADKIAFLLEISEHENKSAKIFSFLKMQDYRSPEIMKRMELAYSTREKDVWEIAKNFLKAEN